MEENGIKLMATCYFQLHLRVFESASKSASTLYEECGRSVEKYLDTVRLTIWDVHGHKGKLNCPAWDALQFQVKRAAAVLAYWQAAFDVEMVMPEFRNRGWAVESGDESEGLNSDNVVIQLSKTAFLNKANKVKVLSCSCKAKNADCKRCKCGTRGVACTPGYCACGLKCILRNTDWVSQFNDEGSTGSTAGLTPNYLSTNVPMTVTVTVKRLQRSGVRGHLKTSGSTRQWITGERIWYRVWQR